MPGQAAHQDLEQARRLVPRLRDGEGHLVVVLGDDGRGHRHVPRGERPHRRTGGGRGDGRAVEPTVLTVGAGDVGGVEADRIAGVHLEVAGARRGGQVIGVGDPEDRARLGGRECLERDAVRQVTVEPAQSPLLESLRGQQQVDVQASAQAADGEEQFGELRLGREQFGELVHHDHQCRQRVQRRPLGAGGLVLADVGVVAGRSQDLLASRELALQRVAHAVDHRDLRLEVRDHRRDVGEGVQPEERGAALEVHEHQVQRIRVVGGDQSQHECAQKLGLSRPRGADAQPVRSHPAVGGLLEVEGDRRAVGTHAHRDPEAVTLATATPRDRGVDLGGHADAQEVGEPRGAPGGGGAVGIGHGVGRTVARQRHREPFGLRRAHGVDARDVLVTGLRPDAGHPVVVDAHAQTAPQREVTQLPRAATGDLEDRHAVESVLGEETLGAGHPHTIDDDDEVRLPRDRLRTRGERVPVRDLGSQHGLRPGQRELGEPDPPAAVGVDGVFVMREPFEPLPRRTGVAFAGRHGDPDPVRTVGDDEPGDHRADCGAHHVRFPVERQCGERPELQGHGQVLDHRVHPHEATHAHHRDRLEVIDRARVGRVESGRQRLAARSHPHGEVLGVGLVPLPHPRGAHQGR